MNNYLKELEAESIYIIREVAAEFNNPVVLYSIGKDSSVLLHLILKAFYPEKPPFKFLHIDTGWKFKEMIAFRDKMASDYGFELLVHKNPEGMAMGLPKASTAWPRVKPSVESIAMARTVSSPMCCCVSSMTFSPRGLVTTSAS